MIMKTVIDPRDYRSPFAGLISSPEEYRRKRFAEAAGHVREGMTMHVHKNGVWSGSFPDKVEPGCTTSRSVQSYERIGYHSGSDWFLQGFLLAGGKVIFHGFKNIDGEVVL